jgi:hypothetical protein
METTPTTKNPDDALTLETFSGEAHTTAWQLVDVGRYMPRRIRGSMRGRELG